MYVIDLLKNLDANEIIEELVKIPYFFDDIDIDNRIDEKNKEKLKKEIKQKYLNELKKITSKSNIEYNDNEILIISNRIGNETNCLDCFTINIKNDKEKLIKNLKVSNFEDIYSFNNPTKGICFLERKYILGFRVSNVNMKRYGKIVLAAHILKELTTFAIDEKEREIKTNEIIESLTKEFDKNIDKTYSIKELREKLGIKDTETNIEKYRKKYLSYCDTYKSIINVIFDIQEILVEENIIDDNYNGIDE